MRDQSAKKKRLLIAYGNPYVFNGTIAPLIPRLSNRFKIFLVTTNFFLTDKVLYQFESWKKSRLITDYLIVPVYRNTATKSKNEFKIHLFMRRNLNYLSELKFDICIFGSSANVWERYIVDCALTKSCIKIGWWVSGFPIARHDHIVNGFLAGITALELVSDLVNPWFLRETTSPEASTRKRGLFNKVLTKWQDSNSFWLFTKTTLSNLKDKLINTEILDRKLYPRLMVGRSFPLGKFDNETWFDSDRFDVILVLQRFPELFLKSLYPHAKVFITQSPLSGSCRCFRNQSESFNVLVSLSGFEGTKEQVELLCRDLKVVMSLTGAKSAHIRPHPREMGSHLDRLIVYLQRKGLNAIIVGNEQPIREIVCDYMGVVGCASASLWEARTSCDYAFVVGLVALSQTFGNNPKYIQGDIEGLEKRIDWIEADGSYDPEIFQRKYHPAPKYRTIPDILQEMAINPEKFNLRS